ncbi:hypothetical protein J2Z22_002501 [Paenibacillus forsythiae]|uniref:Uncharacterized protein n=1 Tax=Paenibacillus forsythiae TaxID=365616 RepID=A0ABU3H820_9BACL|nr:hypothetical protein [Paenibacillus forsythiae]
MDILETGSLKESLEGPGAGRREYILRTIAARKKG